MRQISKDQQLKELLHLTISNCNIDSRKVLLEFSEKILKEYTMTSLLEEIINSFVNKNFDSFLVKLVTDRMVNVPGREKQNLALIDTCKDTMYKLYDVGYVFWNTVYEAGAVETLKDRIGLIFSQWKETQVLNGLQIDSDVKSSLFFNQYLAMFIVVLKLYNMFATLILTREESKLATTDEQS